MAMMVAPGMEGAEMEMEGGRVDGGDDDDETPTPASMRRVALGGPDFRMPRPPWVARPMPPWVARPRASLGGEA
eukprot:4658109-Prymnesium_polylepis.1